MKQIILCLCTLFFGLGCKTDLVNLKTTDHNSNIVAQLDEYLSAQSKYFQFNGNVLVAEHGAIIFQKSYGYADFGTKRMLNDSSVFELASVSSRTHDVPARTEQDQTGRRYPEIFIRVISIQNGHLKLMLSLRPLFFRLIITYQTISRLYSNYLPFS